MSFVRRLSAALLLIPSLLLACASDANDDPTPAGDDGSSYEDDLKNAEKNGKPSQKWIYDGMLPRLDKVDIVASLKSHTVRVTGLLPKGFSGPLPFYAEPKVVGDVTKLTVVYPIATGRLDPSTGKAPAAMGNYKTLFGIAYTPTNEHAPWGGFPFLMYNASRGIAFHGPITSETDVTTGDLEWYLQRGPVSHGCNRMSGEHVVELANLIGIDMSKPHSSSERFTLAANVTVTPDFDTFDGMQVDVDYPTTGTVERPTGPTAKLYKTWLSDDFPRFVCAYQADRPAGPGHCANQPANVRDPATGNWLVTPSATPWLGSSCDSDAACGFQANGVQATCSLGTQGAGVCAIPCEGGCPDRTGSAQTFCATFADGKGRCIAKAGTLNQMCASSPGTAATLVDRFVGQSTAKAAKATVCLPK